MFAGAIFEPFQGEGGYRHPDPGVVRGLRELCDRGLWMRQGRLVADGPIDEVVDRYLEWVANPTTE